MQTIEERINELIELIINKGKEIDFDVKKVFLNGNCGNMFTIFVEYFPKEAVVPYEILYKGYPYHIVSKINGKFYDITGETTIEKYVEYFIKNNKGKYDEKDFEIREIPPANRGYRIRQQSNVYGSDLLGRVPYEISSKMDHLNGEIKKIKESKEK